MAYTTINKSSDHFTTKFYTGNGGSLAVTGVGFQPDWLWIKQRDSSRAHQLMDAVRGASYRVFADQGAEQSASALTSFDSDGFTVDGSSLNGTNINSGSFLSWCWKMGGSGSANTDGSINSTVSVNSTAKMSIVKWTGTGSNATIGHGLGVAPTVILCKRLNGGTQSWLVYTKDLFGVGNTSYINLNTTDGRSQSAGVFNSTAPTSTVFSTGTGFLANDYIAYCFTDLTGFFKSGLYEGNAQTNGPFVYTGHKPAFIIMKEYTNNGQGWNMKTTDSNTFVGNPSYYFIKADTTDQENQSSTSFGIDILSNGFKLRNTDGIANGNGRGFLYMSWAKAPLVGSNNIPATAR